jgi:HD-GYP domain-containing protein (c-di-GMP phosphodiesterase class II)
MRMHAAHTETILSRISAFRDLAPIAATHHERLDGKG